MAANINNLLIPNVTKTSNQKKIDVSNRLPKEGDVSEFSQILEKNIKDKPLHGGIELSAHAIKRLEERKIDFRGEEYMKVKDAMVKLREKGGQSSLIVSDKAAYIVDIKNNKLVTAVDKESMSENIFTKIDSTMFIN